MSFMTTAAVQVALDQKRNLNIIKQLETKPLSDTEKCRINQMQHSRIPIRRTSLVERKSSDSY